MQVLGFFFWHSCNSSLLHEVIQLLTPLMSITRPSQLTSSVHQLTLNAKNDEIFLRQNMSSQPAVLKKHLLQIASNLYCR